MMRTSNRHNGIKDGGWTAEEMDLADWMINQHIEPGGDLSGYFGG